MNHTIYTRQVFHFKRAAFGRIEAWHAKAWGWTGGNLSAVAELAVENYVQQVLLSTTSNHCLETVVSWCLCWQSGLATSGGLIVGSPTSYKNPFSLTTCRIIVSTSHWSQTYFFGCIPSSLQRVSGSQAGLWWPHCAGSALHRLAQSLTGSDHHACV